MIVDLFLKIGIRKTIFNTFVGYVMFRNGYSKNSPSIKCLVEIKKGQGKLEWGAEPNKEYYILEILEILEVQNEQ